MDEDRRGYAGWRVVGACSAGLFCASAPYQVFAVFLKPMTEEFSWSREAAAAAFGAMALLSAVAAAPMGRLLDQFGARRVIVPSLIISGCAVTSLSLLTSSLWHFYLTGAVIGLATVGASQVAYSRVIFSWFDRYRGRALGLMLAGAAVSVMVLPPIAAQLIQRFGWRIAWLTFGLLTLIVGVPIVWSLLEERTAPDREAKRQSIGGSVAHAIRSLPFWTLIVVLSGSALAISGMIVHLSALLTDRGLSPSVAALVISSMGIANLAGRLSTGWMLDRYPAPRVSAALLTISAAGLLLMSNTSSLGVAVAAAVLMGLGAGGEMDINPYLLSRYFGMRSLSTLYGFHWLALGIASTIGPVLMGRAFDTTGTYTIIVVELAMVTLAMAALTLTLPTPARPAIERQEVA